LRAAISAHRRAAPSDQCRIDWLEPRHPSVRAPWGVALEHRSDMSVSGSPLLALLGLLVCIVVGVAAYVAGRGSGVKAGRSEELERQRAAKATAEESAQRIRSEAERDAEGLRKSAVVTGKEELLRLRETQEAEVRRRREEVEREERRLQERESRLDGKGDTVDQ